MKCEIVELSIVVLLLLGALGCASTTVYAPGEEMPEAMRSTVSVSSEEMRQVAVRAVNDVMRNARFLEFLNAYKEEKRDPSAIPTLKLTRPVNDTNDPDLNVGELTDMLQTELLNAGKVNVSLAEGAGGFRSSGSPNDLLDDDRFDKATVVEAKWEAARLALRTRVASNLIRDGRRRNVVRTFTFNLRDEKTGRSVWNFVTQQAFVKQRGVFGW